MQKKIKTISTRDLAELLGITDRRIQQLSSETEKVFIKISRGKYDLAGSTTDRCSCYILALFWTGCRISELVNIKLIHCTPGDPVFIRVIGKGMEEGTVFMPQSLYNRIRTVFGGSIYLFETKDHRRANRQTVSEEIKRQAGRKEHIYATAHIFRHSKAMYLKERGVSIDKIALALRHKQKTTTLAYYQHGSPTGLVYYKGGCT